MVEINKQGEMNMKSLQKDTNLAKTEEMFSEYVEASLSLFKGLTAENTKNNSELECSEHKIQLLQHGILVPNDLLMAVSNLDLFTSIAVKLYGIDLIQLNSSFYKNFSEVDSRSDLELAIDQLLHYASTYGGHSEVANHGQIFEPEALDEAKLVSIKDSIKNFTVLSLFSKTEIKAKLKSLLTSGMALSGEDINRVTTMIKHDPIDYYDEIANKEVMVTLFDEFNYVPKNFDEFMRYIEYQVTGRTLLIKDKHFSPELLSLYLSPDTMNTIDKLFYDYVNKYGVDAASENARRYQHQIKMFHSMSSSKPARRIYNRIMRRSKNHYISRKVSPLEHVVDYTLDELTPYLDRANSYKLVKIYNYLSGILDEQDDYKLYSIRNGSSFLKNTEGSHPIHKLNKFKLFKIRNYIKELISKRVSQNMNKLGIYSLSFSEGTNITIPTSGKDFIGSMPFESEVLIPKKKGLLVGIGWDEHADLDLHASDTDGNTYGWNSMYRDENNKVTYSGDMTDINEKGHAAEFYRILPNQTEPVIITASQYWGESVGFSLFINEGDDKNPLDTYGITGSVSKYSAFLKDRFSNYQASKMLVVIVPDEEYFRVFFIGKNFLNARVPNITNAPEKALEFLTNRSLRVLKWEDLELPVGYDSKTEKTLLLAPKVLSKDIMTDLLN